MMISWAFRLLILLLALGAIIGLVGTAVKRERARAALSPATQTIMRAEAHGGFIERPSTITGKGSFEYVCSDTLVQADPQYAMQLTTAIEIARAHWHTNAVIVNFSEAKGYDGKMHFHFQISSPVPSAP